MTKLDKVMAIIVLLAAGMLLGLAFSSIDVRHWSYSGSRNILETHGVVEYISMGVDENVLLKYTSADARLDPIELKALLQLSGEYQILAKE